MNLTAHLVETVAADAAAYDALVDLSALLAERPETMVIGGHMVSLICAAFPSPGLIARRTGDADAGIPIELADSGELHQGLIDLGYVAQKGNRYVKGATEPQPTIDLLIPSYTGRFGDERRGGRWFNTMPGLPLAMSPRLEIATSIIRADGTEVHTVVAVPSVEAAIVLKAIAWNDRRFHSQKDAIDLSNLFAVLHHHGAEAVGGWRMDEAELSGARRDAASHLHTLADMWEARPPDGAVDARALVSRIRSYVTRP